MQAIKMFNVGAAIGIVFIMVFSAFSVWAINPTDNSTVAVSKDSTLYINGYEFDCLVSEPDLPPALRTASQAPGTDISYLIHMTGPIAQEWADTLSSLGIDIVTYIPNYAYEVRMTESQAELASKLYFVDWVGFYHPAYKISPEISGSKVTVTLEGNDIPQKTIDGIRSCLRVIGESATTTGYIFHGEAESSDSLSAIAAYPHVQFISPYQEPELMDEAGSQIIGGYMIYNDPDSNPNTPYRGSGTHGGYANQIGYDGAGITMGIADTGLGNGGTGNAGHVDFTGRILGGYSYDGADYADGHGHGTHCAGLATADAFEGSGLTYAGFGPYYVAQGLGHEANLYAEKIFSDGGGWIGPADYGDILEVGYAGGARIHTNSWGSASGGAYGAADQAYDTKARDSQSGTAGNQNMVIFVAAGNSYSLGSTGSPGNGKNVIAIGATENYMPDSMSHGNTDENGDNPDGITDFSSKGWTDDGRVKPDVSAPGRATLSTHSAQIPGTSNLYGLYTEDDTYEWCSGTSQATPTACGAGIAVMDWYNTIYGSMPTPSMVKALMVNSAVDIPDEDNNGNPNNAYPIPNEYEGWGRVYIPTVVDPTSSWLVYDAPTELTTGTYDEYTFTYVNSGLPVKLTLAYSDRYALSGAAVTLINNLDLRVTSPSGLVYHGNAFSGGYTPAGTNPSATFDTNTDGWDDRNNVECVYIAPGGLESGLYTVRITGFAVPGDCDNDGANDQDYSLVIHNAQDVTSFGVVNIQYPKYLREASVQVSVMDMDLNTGGGVQTTSITVTSVAEPAGESVLLTETGGDTGVFQGYLTISGTNGAGILWVNALDTITATYNDANYGGTGPFTLTDTAIVDGSPPGAPSGLTVEWYGLVQQQFFLQNFEGDGTPTFGELGWTTGGASNDWQIGTPAGLGTPPDPVGAYGGTFSIGNDLTGLGTYPGEYQDNLAVDSNYIISAPMACTGYTDVQLQIAKYLGVESSTWDHVYIEASTSASGPWTQMWTNTGASISDTAWSTGTYNIASVADNQPAVYVRFEMGNTDGSVTYCGWNIDDMALLGLTSGTMHNTLNWTLSSDDGAGANDVDHYNIYRSALQTGPWDASTLIDTVTKGTATYVDPDRGEFDGINWWYVIRAIDDIGNLEMNTDAVPEIPLVNVPPSAPNNPTPANGATGVAINPTTLSVRAADPNGDLLTVSFYNAAGAVLIGTNYNVPSGTYTAVNWNGLNPTTTYSWFARAYDGQYTTQSSTWSFTTVDTTPPGPVTGLTVVWWGVSFATLIDEHFAVNPAGWTITNTAGTAWTYSAANQRMENTYGFPNSGYLDSPVVDCSGLTGTTLSFWHYWQANYASGTQDGYVRGSIDGGSSWPYLVDEFHHNDPATEDAVKNYTIPWADGHSSVRIRYDIYNYDDWYWRIDDVLMTAGGGSTTEHNWLNWTLSADDGAGANDVDHYNIYRALAASGPWDATALIDTAPAGTATYMDLGRGEPDGINWWYVVRAEDIWGNEEMNTNAVPEISTGLTAYNIDLTGHAANSWVFVSFPHAVSGNIQDMLNDVTLGDGATTWTRAMWYNPQTPNDPWKTYRVGSTTNDLTTVSNLMGVWLWITANGGDQQLTVGVTGDYSAVAVNINLYTGWNIVGYPTATSRAESATLPAAADFVAVWQVATPYITQHAKGAAMMSHGHAYWVHVTADCTWTVNP